MSTTISTRDTRRRSDRATSAPQRPSFEIRRSWTRIMQYDSRLPQPLVESLWNDPDRLIDDGRVLACKPGVRTAVRFLYEQETFVLKRYQPRSWRHAAKDAFLSSWARRGWLAAYRLIDAGAATPRPVAYLEERFGPLRGRSFLLYEFVPGMTLFDWFKGESLTEAAIDGMARQFDALWQALRTARCSHRDMNPGNFIIGPDGRLWIIDLDKMGRHHSDWALNRGLSVGLAQFHNSIRLTAEMRPELLPWKQRLEALPEA